MSFVVMGYGGFRFSVDTFAYEKMKRKFEANIEEVKIIGSRPSLHRAGWNAETLSLTGTFFPHHLPNNRGLSQLAGMRASVGTSNVMVANSGDLGDVVGRWLLKSIGDDHEHIFIDGIGQKITVEMEFLFDGFGRSRAAAFSLLRLF